VLCVLCGCSTTSALGEDEILYTGIKSVSVADQQKTKEEAVALEEANAALAYAPNSSLFGSSTLRSPFPVGLWIYNAMAGKEHRGLGKWIFNTFATTPRTIASASPDTRVKVATNVLQNYGYFQADVNYALHTGKNPKKQKISYDIKLGRAYMFDSIRYGFPALEDSIIRATAMNSYLHEGGQFSVANLQSEKNRLNAEFHNNGFYYYRTDYINYYADSINAPGRVKLLVVPDKTMPNRAKHPWKFGRLSAFIRNNKSTGRLQGYDDTLTFRRLTLAYQGKRIPISPRVMFRGFKFRMGQPYNEDNVSNTITTLAGMNVFSNVQFSFTPRDTTDTCTVLDVRLDATMDKLIDAELAFNFTQKSNSQIGPDISLTFAKRNAFHRGETLSLTLKGLYYWQTTGRVSGESNRTDTYEWGAEAGYTVPWIAFPGLVNRRRRFPVSTKFSANFTRSNLANLYRYNRLSLGVDYKFQTSRYITHTFTPLNVDLMDIREVSDAYLAASVNYNSIISNIFSAAYVPSMQYVFNYNNSSNAGLNVTTHFTATLKEAGNIISGLQCLFGRNFNEKDKSFIFDSAYSQYVKLVLELRNKFRLTPRSCIATRALLGAARSYGNSAFVPSVDWFYSGGANSVRGFGARSIGPGGYHDPNDNYYLYHSGDIRLELNAEYRFPLFANLYGALFLDAGNVWDWYDKESTGTLMADYELRPSTFLNQIALGTGFGFRFDMEFLVLRFDVGLALHAPYETGKSGYFNIPNIWKNGKAFHFSVGYPF